MAQTNKGILAGLFVWGAVITGLLWPYLPGTVFGRSLAVVVVWMAQYPFATAAGLTTRRYWLMLAVGLPVILGLETAAPRVPYRPAISLAILLLAVVGLLIRRARTHAGR